MNLIDKDIIIYCDGACKGNPGEAGSGLAIYNIEDNPILIYGRYAKKGTNNSAELNALYRALLIASEYKKSLIRADSKYSIDCITKWAYNWKSKGWEKKSGKIKNLEIIKKSHELYNKIKDRVIIEYVKGHSDIEGNELADRMAGVAIEYKTYDFYRYEYNNINNILKLKR